MRDLRKLVIFVAVASSAILLLGAGARDKRPPALDMALSSSPVGESPSYGEDILDDDATYSDARSLILAGEWEQAKALLETAIIDDPDNRGLHQLLAEVHFYFYKDLGLSNALPQVAVHATRALELALSAGEIDYRATDLLSEAAVAASDPAGLDALFTKAATLDGSGRIELAHARALDHLGSAATESVFRRAVAASAESSTGALETFAEWLLDRKRNIDVLELLDSVEVRAANPYLNFLRGVAFERTGSIREASSDYAAYGQFSELYAAPGRFRLPGSEAQQRAQLRFRDEGRPKLHDAFSEHAAGPVATAVSSTQAQQGLSFLICGEACGEPLGAKRAEGWVVRNRVLRGSVSNAAGQGCPAVENGGSSSALGDRYKAVMCQRSGSQWQFDGMKPCLAWCTNPSTKTCSGNGETAAVAAAVYEGTAPDPVGGHCPGGYDTYGGACSAGTRCKGNTKTFHLAGAVFNLAKTSACPAKVWECAANQGKTCGDGKGADNCFFSNSLYVHKGGYLSTGSLSQGQCGITPEFTAKSGTHKGHLEGPENSGNPNFDLFLQMNCGSNCWSNVAQSIQAGSVEDISYNSSSSSSKFRWRVCAVKGAGDLKLNTARPY